MVTVSLLINILILVPVCFVMMRGGASRQDVLGPWTPARGILLSMYMAILALSVILLIAPNADAVVALLLMQIFYKVTTPMTVGTVRNPVVVANLFVSAVHLTTLFVLWAG